MIRFVLVSNFINHHQIPFCNAMEELTQGSFAFIQTSPMTTERKSMGWETQLPSYVVLAYENKDHAMQLIMDAEVVIFGGAEDESYITPRLQAGKKVFRYSERIYREGQWKAISPRGLRRKYLDHTRYRNKDVSLLCAGAYVPSDFHIIRAYPDKMYRFGYFPELRVYDDLDSLMAKKDPISLLWVARFIPLKHPELAVETARYLKEKGIPFHLTMIGDGECKESTVARAKSYGLEEDITFAGFMKPDKVRDAMEQAAVFLMTSNFEEGWGAVVNEAMNSGCAVVANVDIGSVPFLIHHGKSGMAYNGKQELFSYTEKLLADQSLREEMGRNGYQRIRDLWNPTVAAKRLIETCDTGKFYEDDGPLSKAPVIGVRKMNGFVKKRKA